MAARTTSSRSLVRVSLDDASLTIVPRGLWKVWSFSQRRVVPFDTIVSAQLSASPHGDVPMGLRMAGLDVVAYQAGYFRCAEARAWWCYRNGGSATVIRTSDPKCSTLVFTSGNDAELVAQIQDRLSRSSS